MYPIVAGVWCVTMYLVRLTGFGKMLKKYLLVHDMIYFIKYVLDVFMLTLCVKKPSNAAC